MTSRPYRETESGPSPDFPDVPDWVNERSDDLEVYWERPRAHWGRRILVSIGVLLVALIAAAVGVVLWVNGHLNGAGGEPVAVTLPDQAGRSTLTSILTHAGVVSDSWLFRHYLDYRGIGPVAGGQYTFHRHEGYRAALHDLGNGPRIVQFRVTIPEGYDMAQIAAKVGTLPGLSAQRFLQVVQSGVVRSPYEPDGSNDLEGLVFPDTYFVDKGQDEVQVLQMMVDRFNQVATQVNLSNSQAANGLTPYQTVVLASLIEREAKVPQDRGKIARVIINRLADRMKLQIDATVEYALGVHKARLSDADLATPSPYNTYLHAGLPPGPIANPGAASLQAALNPTPGSWLYYVLIKPDGEHGFATTQAQFNQLVAEARAAGLVG